MNILILTNPSHMDFLWEVIKNYQQGITLLPKANYNIPYDIGISFMYQHRVPAEQVNTHTWINFHPGPLPEYKGRNLCYHAIMNSEKEFGATVHYMDENFDTGDIIDVQKFVILSYYTAEDVSEMAMEMARIQFEIFFPRILAGEQFERMPNVGGTYYKKDIIPENNDFTGVWLGDWVRAVTYKEFYPKITVGGVTYKIVKDE